jgi:hypothetical protein|tara:strand:- start:406 stop:663 length:258 start_codon:yes stop_codon:yes gene_type:complete
MVPNKIPKKIFVLIIANMFNPFEIFFANTCVIVRIGKINTTSNSKEKNPALEVIIKNQNVSPDVTASDLNLGDDAFILYRINECY